MPMWQKFKNYYHFCNAVVANLRYLFPSKNLIVVGVTGTDGKTTTVSLIYHILKIAKLNVSMISSVGAIINGKDYPLPFHVTTPSSFALQKFLKMAIEAALATRNYYLVLEVTSHALDQYRTWGIDFDIGVLTNITHEHLDYHKTYENYVKTKAKLLKLAKTGVVNVDDDSYKIISNLKALSSRKLITYGIKNKANVAPDNFIFKTNLIGEFNQYNSLAAIAVCKSLGISDSAIKKGTETFIPPIGRQEVVYKNDFSVMIDFAHTPNSFDKILSQLKLKIKGKIIHVFGAAGLRDVTKRPLMGKISAKYSDSIILTSEDPRTESIEKIIDEIQSGIPDKEARIKNSKLLKVFDRQQAINKAILMAQKGDLVLITGKAHEESMNYGEGEKPWNEYKAVEKGLKLKKNAES